MSTNGKEYKLAIRIAGIVDKSYDIALVSANSTLKTFSATMKAVDGDFTKLDKGFNEIMNVGQNCFQAVAAAASVATAAIGAATAAAIKVGSEFESAFAGVKKTVDATEEQYARLREDILEMTRTIPVSAAEIASVMEIAGQLGIATESLTEFTETMINLGVSTNMTAEDAATELARFANIVSMADYGEDGFSNWERLGSVVVDLGNNFATTEGEIVAMATRLASTGDLVGLTEAQIMALSTAMNSVGIQTESGGSTMSKLLKMIQIAVELNTESLEKYAAVANMTGEQFAETFQNDAIVALSAFIDGLNDTERNGKSAIAILDELDIKEIRLSNTILALANAEGVMSNAIATANAAWDESTALAIEAGKKYETVESQTVLAKNAFEELGIEAYDEMRPMIVEALSAITDKVHDFSDNHTVQKWIRNISTEFPTLKRKFTKYAEPVFNVMMNSGKWIVQHGSGIISVIAGIGTALAAYKAASTAVHLVNTLMGLASLNPVTLAILGAVAAIGALTTAITAYKQYERGLIDESLSSHFGNIALSMEELRKVAEYIVQTGNFDEIRKAMDAFDGLDEYARNMSDAVMELDKMNWQISIGMTLDEDEQESYKQAIQDYVDAAQNYALQGQYAVSLNLSAVFNTDDLEQSNIVDQINLFYSDKYSDLQELGTKLNEAVTEAFNDGLLEIDEVDKIRQIQQQMAEIEQALALGNYEATLSAIGIKYSGAELDSETFQNLMEELKAAANEVSETYRESYRQAQAATNAAYNAGYLTDEEYEAASQQNEASMINGIAETNLRALQYQINSIYESYGDEIGQYQQAVQNVLSEYGSEAYQWEWEDHPDLMWDKIVQELENAGPSREDKQAIEELMENMTGQITEFEALIEQWDILSPEVQAEIMTIDQNLSTLRGITVRSGDNLFGWSDAGDIKGLYRDLANQVMGSDDYATIKEWLDDYYEEFIGYSYDNAQAAAQQVARDTQSLIDENFSADFFAEASVAVTLNPFIRNSNWSQGLQGNISSAGSPYNANGTLTGPYSQNYINAWDMAHGIDHNAFGGIVQNKELSWLAENGPEAVIPLDGSRRAVSLWEKAGQLLGMDSILDRYDISGGGQTVTIDYNPTLQFYGEAPNRDDLTEALRLSQDEFDSMMERYLKTSSRVSFTT